MFFWILLIIAGLCVTLPFLTVPIAIISKDIGIFFASFLIGITAAILPGLITMMVWSCHADDIGTIIAQQEVIMVYEKQRDDLNKTMSSFKYPAGSLLNADSPVRSIVEQLANVEKLLADARAEKAEAIKSIEQRRVGPVSGVIGFAGDYR